MKLFGRGLLVVALFLSGCPPAATPPDAGEEGVLPAPEVTAIAPAKGPKAGGTVVSVLGRNFRDGLKLYVGDALAADVVVVSELRLTAKTPASATGGAVDVKVENDDGQFAVLSHGFFYETLAFKEAVILNDALAQDTSGSDPATVLVSAEVEVQGLTAGAGQGSGVLAQMGLVQPTAQGIDLGQVRWEQASYTGDSTDLARDRYSKSLQVAKAVADEVRTYALLSRFSLDNGATWTLADRDGLQNGFDPSELPRWEVSRPVVDWCKLGGQLIEPPVNLKLKVGQPGPVVFGQVYRAGVTNSPGAGGGMAAQLGYGALGSPPSAGWTWLAATFNVDTGSGANDEYMATLPTAVEGSFSFAYRFNVNGGPFRLCDANGSSEGGFTTDQMGSLSVSQVDVGSCALDGPAQLAAVPGGTSLPVAARAFAETVTDSPGAGTGLVGEVGFGPTASDPSAGGWNWVQASYTGDGDSGASDKYERAFAGLPTGNYDVAFRFRYAQRPYVYCDLDGSANGYSPAKAAHLAVAPAAIEWCNLQYVDKSVVPSGEPVTAYGRVRIPGLTELPALAPGVRAEVGVGTAGTNASSNAAWGWKRALYNVKVASAGAEEYMATFQPAYSGNRAVSFRFSLDDGASWTYCDLDGAGASGGYDVGQQHSLTVSDHATFDYCALTSPEAVTQAADGGTTVFGQVYEPGLTEPAGADPSVTAALGYGKKIEDPGVADSWNWIAASFGAQAGNNDEYQAPLAGADAGSYHYAFRFSNNGGQSYCFGDLNGGGSNGAGQVWGGFSGEKEDGGENLGVATVTP